MWLLDARAAFSTLLSILMVPAATMVALGILFRYRGIQSQSEDRQRLGKMLTMFGTIFLIIVLVCSWFLFNRMGMA